MLTCEECGCVSLKGRGWIAQVAEYFEDYEGGPVGAEVVAYCPPCAEREFEIIPRVISYT